MLTLIILIGCLRPRPPLVNKQHTHQLLAYQEKTKALWPFTYSTLNVARAPCLMFCSEVRRKSPIYKVSCTKEKLPLPKSVLMEDLYSLQRSFGEPPMWSKPQPFCFNGLWCHLSPSLNQASLSVLFISESPAFDIVPGTINIHWMDEYLYHIVTMVAKISLSLGQQRHGHDLGHPYSCTSLWPYKIPLIFTSGVRLALTYRWSESPVSNGPQSGCRNLLTPCPQHILPLVPEKLPSKAYPIPQEL